MKVSLNWIKDYVNIPDDIDIAKLTYDLTMSTVEVEGYTDLGAAFNKIIVGEIKELLPHPNADKLRVCRTDIGNGDIREIVCGGSNLSVGMKVAVAVPGAKVRWHGEGDLVEIKNAKLRGVESYGMICASSEIGLFDLFPYEEEATIIDLCDFTAVSGTPLADALDMNDIILEIDNKSLTNRPDLWGHYGIAREISALYDLPLTAFTPYEAGETNGFKVEIANPDLCRRYIGTRIEGLSVKAAPFAMQSRISRVGMRPINAIVDITNYVMLATGQPTHAFDADNISGHITVREAKEGEKLLLLNDQELSLSTADLVIADDEEAVGLAGVMGGRKDSVLAETNKIILEIANFEAISIRHTAARYETRTEAATRFEKAIDPDRADLALSLAMELFKSIYPELKVTGYADNYPTKLSRAEINLSLSWLSRRLGKALPNDEIKTLLSRLGFSVSIENDDLKVIAPSWRSTGDISIDNDIMEEVARMHGFENFTATPIVTSFTDAINQPKIDLERNIKEYLAYRCGMREIFTYPWMNDEFTEPFLAKLADKTIELSAPPSPTESRLRSTLLPNLCRAVNANLRYFHDFAIFESAQTLWGNEFIQVYDEKEKLPVQRRNIAGAIAANRDEVGNMFRRLKGIITMMPRYTHLEPFTFTRAEKPDWSDETVWLNIEQNDNQVGNIALLSTKSALSCGIKNSAVMLFEIDLDALTPLASRTNHFVHIPEYPRTDYDISMLVPHNLYWEQIEAVVTEKMGSDSFVHGISFVDEYHGKQIPEGKKSITIRLVIGSDKKTLTSEEIEASANAVIKRLNKKLGAELR